MRFVICKMFNISCYLNFLTLVDLSVIFQIESKDLSIDNVLMSVVLRVCKN